MKNRLLLLYSSVDGHTRDICDFIKNKTLSKADLYSLDDPPCLEDYDVIVIGASIRYGNYRKNLFDFLQQNREVLDKKETAFFSVNVVARKEGKNNPKNNPYVLKFLTKTSWRPAHLAVFAGKIDYPRYKFVDRYAIKLIMRITSGPTDTSKTYEFTDWQAVEAFAKKF